MVEERREGLRISRHGNRHTIRCSETLQEFDATALLTVWDQTHRRPQFPGPLTAEERTRLDAANTAVLRQHWAAALEKTSTPDSGFLSLLTPHEAKPP